MFEKMMPGQVALCTNLMAYRPEAAHEQSNIVVGTPQAIESALSKVCTSYFELSYFALLVFFCFLLSALARPLLVRSFSDPCWDLIRSLIRAGH
jgi:hypothetical protein